jgi:cell division inhibitor SepF
MSSGLWYRTLVYLGLKEEPEEGYDDLPERNGNGNGDGNGNGWGEEAGATRHDRFDPAGDPDLDPDRARGRSRSRDHARDHDDAAVTADSNVRPLRAADAGHARTSGSARLAVVEVEVFDDVETVGARYRDERPVLFDLGAADRATARRVVDFVSGLTYALHGRMHKVGTRAFLLVPEGVRLPDDEVRRLTTLGYHLPTGSDV